MTDETTTTTVPETESADVLSNLNKAVATKISYATEKIVDSVVDQFVSQEISRRATALFEAVNATNKARDEFKKFKPDVQAFDVSGKLVSESWSKAKLDERNKALEKLKKMEKALELAFKGDYSKVLNGSQS